jgi:hypothetical protein
MFSSIPELIAFGAKKKNSNFANFVCLDYQSLKDYFSKTTKWKLNINLIKSYVI